MMTFKKISTALLLTALMPLQAFANTFTDVDATNTNYLAIEYLVSTGTLQGYSNNTFKADQTINRAELMKILVAGQGIDPDANTYQNCFPDVTTDWYAKYVCYAHEQGWVDGYPDNTFKPAQTVNKVEAAKMIVNAYGFTPATEESQATSSFMFTDVSSTDWFYGYVMVLTDVGVVDRDAGSTYSPANDMSRGSVAEYIFRCLVANGNDEEIYTDEFRDEFLTTAGLSDLIMGVPYNYAVYTLNAYTDLINNAEDAVSSLNTAVQNVEYDMTNYDASYGVTFSCNFLVADKDNLYTETMDSMGLEASEASELKTQATSIFTTLDSIDGLCKDLHKYVAAQEYKTDNFVKGTDLVTQLYTAMDDYYDAHDIVLDKVETLFEKYSTWVVDLDDPTSVAIDNMDKDLKQASDILDMVEEAYLNIDYTQNTALQTLLDALNTTVASHSGSNTPEVPSEYKAQVDDFYKDMGLKFSTAGTLAIRAMNKENIDDLWSSYTNLLNSYNSMIDTYNYFLDVTGY